MNAKLKTSHRQGSVLLVTLVIIGVVGLTLFAYLNWSQTRTSLGTRSQLWNSALPLAEAGIEEAMAHLNSARDRGTNGWTLAGGFYNKRRNFSDEYYTVSIETNANPAITSTGFVRVPATDTFISRAVTVTCRAKGGAGILAKRSVVFSGGAMVDSFDSSDGAYTLLTRKDNAAVLCNASTPDCIHIGTAEVYGKAATGPAGTVTTDSNGALGDLAWHAAARTGIQPGATSADVSASFPSNSPPTGAFFTPACGYVGAIHYTYILGDGSYQASRFTVAGGEAVAITGDSELYVTSDFTVSGSGYLWIAPGASLTIYVNGKFTCSGGGIINGTGLAANLSVLGLNGCTVCTYSGTSAFVGTINTPNAAVTVSGGAGFYGAMTGDTIVVSGDGGIHYDEALGSGKARYVVDSWNE